MRLHSVLVYRISGGSRALALASLMLIFAICRPATALEVEIDFSRFTLDQAIGLALGHDEFLQQVQTEVEGAKGSLVAARSGQLPHLALTGQYARNLKKPAFFLPPEMGEAFGVSGPIPMGGDNDLLAAVKVTFNLWTAGRLSAAEGIASEMLMATRFRESAVADGVLFNTSVAYNDVLLASENLQIAIQSLAAAEESRRVAEAGFNQGTLSNFDHLRARVEVANRQAPLIVARNDLAQSMLVLERRCGLRPATIVDLADSLGGVAPPADQDSLVAEMIRGSSEIQALNHTVAAARQGVLLQKAGNKPMLLLSGDYALQGQWDSGATPDDNEYATSSKVALGLAFPIFDGKRTAGLTSRASADLRQVELELARVTRDKELAVRQAWMGLANALAALEGRTEAVILAEESYRLAVVRVTNGLATPLERLDAELALTSARVQQAVVQYACNIAEANLALAVGNTSAPFLDETNSQEIENE